MSHSFRLTAAEVDSHPIPMMERAPLKTPAATFGSFPAAPGYHSVIEQVLFSFFFNAHHNTIILLLLCSSPFDFFSLFNCCRLRKLARFLKVCKKLIYYFSLTSNRTTGKVVSSEWLALHPTLVHHIRLL